MTTYIGQSLKRFEDTALVTGQGSFINDIVLPGMLYAAVLRSDFAHAEVKSLDVTDARALPGVAAVLTASDIAGVIPDIPSRPMTGVQAMDVFNAPGHPVLAKDKTCYAGQAVAIVVASDQYTAREALDLIRVEYLPLPPALEPRDAVAKGAPVVHAEVPNNVAMEVTQTGGDVEAAFAEADHVTNQRFDAQRLAPVPMETRGVIADYQPDEAMLTVWNSTQAAHRVKEHISDMLQHPPDGLRVVTPEVGGTFGMKDCIFPEDILVPYLSLLLRKPVKWIEDRQENLLAYHGRGMDLDMELAVKGDGTILGMRFTVFADLGAFFLLTTASAPFNALRRVAGPYHIPAVQLKMVGAVTNKTPTGAYRGTGGPESAFCMERSLDMIARDLGLDPVEVRRRNFIPVDAFPYETATGVTYDAADYTQGFQRALDLSDYYGWKAKAAERASHESSIGVGMATILKSSGASGHHREERARVTVEPDGRVSVYTGISPHGQGNSTSFAQIVADELGVDPSQVEVRYGDTAAFPFGYGTSASRGLIVGGSALFSVLSDTRTKLASVASHMLGCSPGDVRLEGARAFDANRPDDGVTFPELAAAAHNGELLPVGLEPGLDFTGGFTLPDNPHSFAAHVAVVEVNKDTGHVDILGYVGVHDCGRIVNPMLVEGQIHGGIAQGIGQALTEGMVYSPEGQPLAGSLMDYAVPRSELMPDLVLDTMNIPSDTNPLGAKGIGSVSTVPAPVAIANAVLDALASSGVRHLDTPLTPEKIWRAIQEGESR